MFFCSNNINKNMLAHADKYLSFGYRIKEMIVVNKEINKIIVFNDILNFLKISLILIPQLKIIIPEINGTIFTEKGKNIKLGKYNIKKDKINNT